MVGLLSVALPLVMAAIGYTIFIGGIEHEVKALETLDSNLQARHFAPKGAQDGGSCKLRFNGVSELTSRLPKRFPKKFRLQNIVNLLVLMTSYRRSELNLVVPVGFRPPTF